MTLIVAMRCQEGLFIAADSLIREEGVSLIEYRKLTRVGQFPLVIGATGEKQTGDWLAADLRDVHESTWRAWTSAAAEVLDKANSKRNKRRQNLGLPANPSGNASLLACGYVGGEPGIAELAVNTSIEVVHDYLAVGSCSRNARIVFETLKRERSVVDERLFRDVVAQAIALSLFDAGFPAYVFRVDPDGVEERDPIEGLEQRLPAPARSS